MLYLTPDIIAMAKAREALLGEAAQATQATSALKAHLAQTKAEVIGPAPQTQAPPAKQLPHYLQARWEDLQTQVDRMHATQQKSAELKQLIATCEADIAGLQQKVRRFYLVLGATGGGGLLLGLLTLL